MLLEFCILALEESGICGSPSTMLRWQGLREATSTVSLSWAPRTCIARGETNATVNFVNLEADLSRQGWMGLGPRALPRGTESSW